ncbi:MAG: septal ring lytic transglycosylase RlpA family protein, partial [Azonexus sp.]
MKRQLLLTASLAVFLAACGSTSAPPASSTTGPSSPPATSKPAPGSTGKRSGGGGYYKDDGPADEIPANLDQVPDAAPRWEPLHKPALRPYEVFGTRYV